MSRKKNPTEQPEVFKVARVVYHDGRIRLAYRVGGFLSTWLPSARYPIPWEIVTFIENVDTLGSVEKQIPNNRRFPSDLENDERLREIGNN